MALTGYWAVRAWRSSPESWRSIEQSYRPASWESWPIYAAIWRDVDRHTNRYLWFARVGFTLAATLFALISILVATRCILPR
jgi:hypothetical protein